MHKENGRVNITKGKRIGKVADDYMRAYDRLRKRSYRQSLKRYGSIGTYHSAYVQGVKDALNEVANGR